MVETVIRKRRVRKGTGAIVADSDRRVQGIVARADLIKLFTMR